MMSGIKIASGLSLPLEFASQATSIFGIRGSGKTNTGGSVAEELLEQNHQIVVVDPLNAWWGLRAAANNSSGKGYPVVIFGGPRGDVPLTENDGRTIAEFVVQERVSIILSLRHLRKNAQRRFVTEFCEELYALKGDPKNQTPLTVFIDEAPLFVPQRVTGDIARAVGAVEDLVARGRNVGFGVVLISQRPATLNADVRTQCETIICHRVTAALDRKAIREWFENNASIENMNAILSSLATLKNGEAWVWSPALGIMNRFQIRMRHTFDSSATPKVGQSIAPPKRIADIDLGKLQDRIKAAIEEKKANDPAELRKRIAELEKKSSVTVVDPNAIASAERSGYNRAMKEFAPLKAAIARMVLEIPRLIPDGMSETPAPVTASKPVTITRKEPVAISRPASKRSDDDHSLSGPEKRILNAIAWLESIGVESPEQTAVAFLAGYTIGGGGFNNPRGALKTKGLVNYLSGDRIALTDEGRAAADYPDTVLTSERLQEMVFSRLPGPESKILRVILDEWPNSVSNQECADRSGYTNGGGGFNNPRGRLKTLGLIEYPSPGQLRARDILFPDRTR